MSNLLDHAERELSIIGMGKDTKDGMNKLMHDNLIDIVKLFSEQGHSGFSANYAIANLEKLLAFEPLSDIRGTDDEWVKVGDDLWQNNRCSRVFKNSSYAYDIEGKIFYTKDDRSDTYTNKNSRVKVTFPYKPTREYVKLEEEKDEVT